MESAGSAPAALAHRTGVVRVGEEHAPLLAAFFRQTWDANASAERVMEARRAAARDNPIAAGVDVPTFLFLKDDRPVGYLTTIPDRLWLAGAEHPLHWLKGLMVLPDYRNGPIGFALVREALRHLDLVAATVVDEPPRRLFAALGMTDLGTLPNHMRILRPRRVLRRLDPTALGLDLPAPLRLPLAIGRTAPGAAALGAAAQIAMAGAAALRGCAATGPVRSAADAQQLRDHWASTRGRMAAGAIRSGRRALRRGGDNYVLLEIGSPVRGWAQVRRPRDEGDPRLGGIRVATLSDLWFDPADTGAGVALVRAAEQAARDMAADALLCTASHSRLRDALRRRSFLPIGGNVHFMLRPPEGIDVPSLDRWWLTRADGGADDAF